MIAFDIDGVVANSGELFYRKVKDTFNVDVSDHTTQLLQIPGLTDEESWTFVNDCIVRYSDEIKPYPRAIENLRKMASRLYDPITFLTARPESTMVVTQKWLDTYLQDIEFNVVHCKTSKAEWLYDQDYIAMVEDNLDYANAISKVVSVCYLVNRPYNIDQSVMWNVKRIDDLKEPCRSYSLYKCPHLPYKT